MKLKIKEDEIELVYSFRSSIYFEQITGKNIDLANLTQNDLITLFYCVVIASLQKAKKPIITMLDFLDAVDDNNGEKCVLEFGNWFIAAMKAQYSVIVGDKEEKEPNTTGTVITAPDDKKN